MKSITNIMPCWLVALSYSLDGLSHMNSWKLLETAGNLLMYFVEMYDAYYGK